MVDDTDQERDSRTLEGELDSVIDYEGEDGFYIAEIKK
jgi:hypothetical protein